MKKSFIGAFIYSLILLIGYCLLNALVPGEGVPAVAIIAAVIAAFIAYISGYRDGNNAKDNISYMGGYGDGRTAKDNKEE